MHISARDMNIEKIYAKLNRIGFAGLDVKFPMWNERESILDEAFEKSFIDKYKKIQDAGLIVCQTHLTYYPGHLKPLGNGTYVDFEKYMLPIFIREIEMTAKMNCNTAVIHLYFDKDRENSKKSNIELIKKLLPVLEKNNVILAIENIYGPEFGDAHLSTAEDLLYYTDYFNDEHVGICLDTGHAIARKENPIKMVEKLNKNIKALHLHSNVAGNDLHLPPCFVSYNLDWQKLYDTLINIGYNGTFNMEISAPKEMDPETTILYYNMIYGIAKSIIKDKNR